MHREKYVWFDKKAVASGAWNFIAKKREDFFAVEIDKTKALCYNANVRDKGGSVRVSRSIV